MAKKKVSNSPMAVTSADESRWRAESDLDTLVRAAEIRKDAQRMAAVRKLAKSKVATLEALKA